MEYRIEKKEAIRIVGLRTPMAMDLEENFKRVPVFWQAATQNGKIPQIAELISGEPAGVLGVSSFNPESGDNYYYIAAATDKPIPDGMFELDIPACTWAVFPGKGAMPSAIHEMEARIMDEWFPSSGYEWGNAPDIEVYLDSSPLDAKFEIWLPVVEKA